MCILNIGGCSVHWGIMSTTGDIRMNLGDTMSTLRDVQCIGAYHEYIGGCSVHQRDIMMHVGEQLDKILSISIENSDVLMIFPLVYS